MGTKTVSSAGFQAGVHLGHLQLVVEVADRAQSLDDRVDVVRAAEVGEQPGEAGDPDVGVRRAGLARACRGAPRR